MVSAVTSSTAVILPICVSLLGAQYVGLFYSATVTYSDLDLCLPRKYNKAWRGWNEGICFTEEQLWCRAHGNRNAYCPSADCRAEEIRLTLYTRNRFSSDETAYLPERKPVYDKAGRCFYQIYDHIEAMNRQPLSSMAVGACAPSEDRLALYLPTCPVEIARCRTIYYEPWDPRGVAVRGQCSISAPLPNVDYAFFQADSWHNQDRGALGSRTWNTEWQDEYNRIMANIASGMYNSTGQITMQTGYVIYT